MIGAPHCRSVESRSSFVAWEGGLRRLLRRGIASVVGELSHGVTSRPCRPTPACRSTSRSCACAPVNSAPPPLADIAAQHTTSLSENGRAFLRHGGVLLRQPRPDMRRLAAAAQIHLRRSNTFFTSCVNAREQSGGR